MTLESLQRGNVLTADMKTLQKLHTAINNANFTSILVKINENTQCEEFKMTRSCSDEINIAIQAIFEKYKKEFKEL